MNQEILDYLQECHRYRNPYYNMGDAIQKILSIDPAEAWKVADWFTCAVALAHGQNEEITLVLAGPQGIGKTRFINSLFPFVHGLPVEETNANPQPRQDRREWIVMVSRIDLDCWERSRQAFWAAAVEAHSDRTWSK